MISRPCKNGVVGMRVAGRCKCVKCVEGVRANDRERYEFREKEKRIAYQNAYYAANKEVCSARNRDYRKRNAERLNQMDRQWYYENQEADNARRKLHYEQNKVETRMRMTAWYAKNKVTIQVKSSDRQRARALRTPLWFSELDDLVLSEAFALCEHRKICTGVLWEVDHMLPLRSKFVSGLNVWNNLQVIPQRLNRAKHSKAWLTKPGEWISHMEG